MKVRAVAYAFHLKLTVTGHVYVSHLHPRDSIRRNNNTEKGKY